MEKYKVALYTRTPKPFKDLENDESNSILNKKLLIQSFLKDK